MGDDLPARFQEVIDNRDGSGTRTEQIIAMWAFDTDAGQPAWLVREWDTSPIFHRAFGRGWWMRFYSYWVWEALVEDLNALKVRTPHLISLDLEYNWRAQQIAVKFLDWKITELDLTFEA